MYDLKQRQAELEQYYVQVSVHLKRRHKNVVHVGLGLKEEGGKVLPKVCYRVYVDHKYSDQELETRRISKIPRSMYGLPLDVLQAGDVILNAYDNEGRKDLVGGLMTKNQNYDKDDDVGAGTLGVLGTDVATPTNIVGLTTRHVVTLGDSDADTRHGIINMMGQPCIVPENCQCCSDVGIGEVVDAKKDSEVDCAFILLHEEIAADVTNVNAIKGMNDVTGVALATCGETVKKRGIATNVTEGIIVDVLYMGSQILIQPTGTTTDFTQPGDSGAVVVNSSDEVVGLLIGQHSTLKTYGVANHIGPVLAVYPIKIGGQDGSSLGIPASKCSSYTSSELADGIAFWDYYDRTTMPGQVTATGNTLVSNPTQRSQDVRNTLRLISPNRTQRRNDATSNIVSSANTIVYTSPLPPTSDPTRADKEATNQAYESAVRMSTYQLGIFKSYYSDGSGGIDFDKLGVAFELFANGDMHQDPFVDQSIATVYANSTTGPPHPAVYRFVPNAGTTSNPYPRVGEREPNGDFFLMFAEFALFCIENSTLSGAPVSISAGDVSDWTECLKIFLRCQEIFMHIYKSGSQSAPPSVLPVGSGAYQTSTTPVRWFGGGAPSSGLGNYVFYNWNYNNVSGSTPYGLIGVFSVPSPPSGTSPSGAYAYAASPTYLSAATTDGQSDITRKLELRNKYKNLTLAQLRTAYKENLQQMIYMP